MRIGCRIEVRNTRQPQGGTGTVSKDRGKVADRPLSFEPFDLIEDGVTHDVIARVRELGLDAEPTLTTDDPDQVIAWMHKIIEDRQTFEVTTKENGVTRHEHAKFVRRGASRRSR